MYKRVLIKISGEALAGEKKTGFDFSIVTRVCEVVKAAADMGVQVGIVIGAGNFWRGVKGGAGKVERVSADQMGMLATAMNCLAVADVFRQLGAKARVVTAFEIQGVGECFDARKVCAYLDAGEIVLFACGTGHPYFSTDTGAVLRAVEIDADAILLVNPAAVKFEQISYDEVLARHLAVMDTTATSLAMDNRIPVEVFALAEPENILRVLQGEKIGTSVN